MSRETGLGTFAVDVSALAPLTFIVYLDLESLLERMSRTGNVPAGVMDMITACLVPVYIARKRESMHRGRATGKLFEAYRRLAGSERGVVFIPSGLSGRVGGEVREMFSLLGSMKLNYMILSLYRRLEEAWLSIYLDEDSSAVAELHAPSRGEAGRLVLGREAGSLTPAVLTVLYDMPILLGPEELSLIAKSTLLGYRFAALSLMIMALRRDAEAALRDILYLAGLRLRRALEVDEKLETVKTRGLGALDRRRVSLIASRIGLRAEHY